jgi:putative ABC transport system permease protein
VVVGTASPLGVIVAFFGGVLSFTALALGAVLVMPPLLRLSGRAFGRSAPASRRRECAALPRARQPDGDRCRDGVTLVVMFAVASASVKALLTAAADGVPAAELSRVLDTFAAIMMGLVAVSAVIAAVGLVNLLTIGVVQRRRELGLLRALGLSSAQVRTVVLLEAVHVTITALAFGLVLGVVYGWVAAQSLLGSVALPPSFAAPTVVAPPCRGCRCSSSSRRRRY